MDYFTYEKINELYDLNILPNYDKEVSSFPNEKIIKNNVFYILVINRIILEKLNGKYSNKLINHIFELYNEYINDKSTSVSNNHKPQLLKNIYANKTRYLILRTWYENNTKYVEYKDMVYMNTCSEKWIYSFKQFQNIDSVKTESVLSFIWEMSNLFYKQEYDMPSLDKLLDIYNYLKTIIFEKDDYDFNNNYLYGKDNIITVILDNPENYKKHIFEQCYNIINLDLKVKNLKLIYPYNNFEIDLHNLDLHILSELIEKNQNNFVIINDNSKWYHKVYKFAKKFY